MITIHKSGISLSFSNENLNHVRRSFERDHFVRLPNLVSPEIMEELHSQMLETTWEERIHDGIGIEVCLSDAGIAALINFLLNDQELFEVIEKITVCQPIGNFSGRVYRMVPNSGHYDSWHTDFGDHRLLALSINLGKEIYEGGVLQLRDRHSIAAPAEISNTRFGDAVLFQLAADLEHRVTNVEGTIPKTAFAGWFRSEPKYWASFESSAQQNTEPRS